MLGGDAVALALVLADCLAERGPRAHPISGCNLRLGEADEGRSAEIHHVGGNEVDGGAREPRGFDRVPAHE